MLDIVNDDTAVCETWSGWLSQGVEKVWSSLAVLLEEIIELGIAATDVVEALWLCQIRLSSTSEV